MAIGMNAAKNHGVLYMITTMVLIHVAALTPQARTMIGILLSALSMSVEKRFTIRPTGVVSKKLIGALRIRCVRLECRCLLAWTPPKNTAMDSNTMVPTKKVQIQVYFI